MSSVSDDGEIVPEREQPLTGGRVTPGVVRVGETVRRPLRGNSEFVRRLLAHLEAAGFAGAPRYLGRDGAGREVFSFLPGVVPDELDATLSDDTLAAAARLMRGFHDATELRPLPLAEPRRGRPTGARASPAHSPVCRAYGCEATSRIVQAILDAVARTLDRLDADAVPWWREQRRWLDENRDALD